MDLNIETIIAGFIVAIPGIVGAILSVRSYTDKIKNELIQTLKAELKERDDKIDKLEAQLIDYEIVKGERELLKKKVEALTAELEEERSKRRELETLVATLRGQVGELTRKLKALQRDTGELRKQTDAKA